MVDNIPDSTRLHLRNADAAVERAKNRLRDSATLRANVLQLRVSQTNLPAVRLPANPVPKDIEE